MRIRYFVCLSFLIILFGSISSCFTFRKSDFSTQKKAYKFGLKLEAKYLTIKEKSYRYFHFENPNKSSPLLVLIHGAPGSSNNFIDFIKNPLITNHYSVIIVDRLGYGYSDYGNYASIQDQSEIIITLVNDIVKTNQDVFLAGHSYGGTITAAIASLRPNFLTASVIMAPALDPKNEKYFWFGKLGKWKASRWMASGALKVASDEKYSHAKELEDLSSKLKDINTPLLHIHGNKDKVVPFINLSYAKDVIPHEFLEVYEWNGMNHFFPFSDTDKTIELMHAYFFKHKSDIN